ncbi:hypothetical protein [Symmachiella dynata]|uniref:DNA polymerase Y family protein n=1 Tax=Symmachiella dynata TaxID=2527995 RepID=UPI0030EEBC21|tara:strand:- start:305 stop:1519 length:1215 start_codon:yes stop_codon:yes gene_type:complete
MKTHELIGHVDSDCFYVSAERVRHEHLRHIPVGVLGNQGACVIAKSYELKARGVKTGMPIWDAAPLCPDAVFVKRDFRWYEVLSRKLLGVIRSVSPQVEYYSIDEMFFDASALREPAENLQQRILQEVGIPVSIGISRSRTLAKLMSDVRKPFGCCTITEKDAIENFIHLQPVEELCGIGSRSTRKLHQHGIRTCWQFTQANRHFIRKLLTIKGEALWWELQGEAVIPILTERKKHKAIARGGSIGRPSTDRERLWAWTVRDAERLIEELDFHRVLVGELVMKLSYKTAGDWSRSVRFASPTGDFDKLLEAAHRLHLVACLELQGQAVTHIDLIAERLCDRGAEQRSLFEADEGNSSIAQLKRATNEKLGRFALRSAATLPLTDIYNDEAFNYDVCDIRDKTCF